MFANRIFRALAAVLSLAASNACAATYMLKNLGSESRPVEFSDPANWRVNGRTPATCPQPGDEMLFGTTNARLQAHLALDGDYSVSDMTRNFNCPVLHRSAKAASGTVTLTMTGAIGGGGYQHYRATEGTRLVFAKGSSLKCAVYDMYQSEATAGRGGEIDVFGSVLSRHVKWTAEKGGTIRYAPSSYVLDDNSERIDDHFAVNGGSIVFPEGLHVEGGHPSRANTIRHDGGTVTFGGGFSSATPWTYCWSAGVLRVVADCAFGQGVAVAVADNARITFDIASGASLFVPSVSYGPGVRAEKSGAGDFVFENGMPLPDVFDVKDGAISLVAPGTYDISGVTFSGGAVKIGAVGVRLASWNGSLPASGRFVSGVASPVPGSKLLSCDDVRILRLARAGFNETLPDGFSADIEGDSLVVRATCVFGNPGVSDLSNPAGWSGGIVPVGKVVAISGAGVSVVASSIPAFAGITVQSGAILTIAAPGELSLPPVSLADGASLVISSGTVDLKSLACTASGTDYPKVTVARGATLAVRGGTVFSDCRLSVDGTLRAITDGDIRFGYAPSGAKSAFGMEMDGGTVSTSCGHVQFFCPAAGGSVSALGTVSLRNASFVHDGDSGFNFCVNNPSDVPVDFVFENTRLEYPPAGDYAVSGGATLSFVAGASLVRPDDKGSSHCVLDVTGRARLVFGAGTSSKFGSSASGLNAGNVCVGFAPDEDGFVSLVVSNASWEAHRMSGNGRGVAEICGSCVHPVTRSIWNWTEPFHGLKTVRLDAGAVLSVVNDCDNSKLHLSETFSGEGSISLSATRRNVRTFVYSSTNSTSTGRLSVAAERNSALVLDAGSSWGGTVEWNDRTSIAHTAYADEMSFGGIDLKTDFNWRIWQDGYCDHYSLHGEGFIDGGGHVTVTVMDGSEVQPGDEWIIARVPAGSYVPTSGNTSWTVESRPVAINSSLVDLVLTYTSVGFTFDTTETRDFCSAAGWASGSVPTNEAVRISGRGVVAEISDANAFPQFASIAVRNGATLKVLADVSLPPLTVDATSKVVFGDGKKRVSAVLDASLTTLADAATDPVSLAGIEVASNATLSIAPGMLFKNVGFRLFGTITKALSTDIAPVFGYAETGETSYIAFTADGATFDFHSQQSEERGAMAFVCPASGGTVVPVGPITLRNVTRRVAGWDDFGAWQFGCNNPTDLPFDVLLDGTRIDSSAFFHAAGAARVTLANGSHIARHPDCLRHDFAMAIQDAATVTVGKGCYIDFATEDGLFGIDSNMAVDAVTVRDGGAYTVGYNSPGWSMGVFASDGGVLGVPRLAGRPRTDPLLGFSSVRLDGPLAIASVDTGTGTVDWDRRVVLANIPFSGTGDVTVTNGVPARPFTVTLRNGHNSATGAIGVSRVPGDAETALYFADGANWAGTVVAGGVALTNLSETAEAAHATFAKLEMAGDFPVRVWKSGGEIFANDALDVGSYAGGAGRLVPRMSSAGEPFAKGDEIAVGKIAKGSALPKTAPGWIATTREIPSDAKNVTLILKACE